MSLLDFRLSFLPRGREKHFGMVLGEQRLQQPIRRLGFHRLSQLVEAFGLFLRSDRLRRRLLRGFKRPPGLGLDEVFQAGNFRERLPEVEHLLTCAWRRCMASHWHWGEVVLPKVGSKAFKNRLCEMICGMRRGQTFGGLGQALA